MIDRWVVKPTKSLIFPFEVFDQLTGDLFLGSEAECNTRAAALNAEENEQQLAAMREAAFRGYSS